MFSLGRFSMSTSTRRYNAQITTVTVTINILKPSACLEERVFATIHPYVSGPPMPSGDRTRRKSSHYSSHLMFNDDAAALPVKGLRQEKPKTFLQAWVEPALQPPAPSFEDYRGLERQGVLQDMAPLGTLPAAKLKAKVKIEPQRRSTAAEGPERALKEDMRDTPGSSVSASTSCEPIITVSSLRESYLPNVSSQLQVKQEIEDNDYVHGGRKALPRPPKMATSLRSPPQTQPVIDRDRLQIAVDKAVRYANEEGNVKLGHAVTRIYQDSFEDESIARLLLSVLAQSPTEDERSRFNKLISKEFKALNKLETKQQSRRSATVFGRQISKQPANSPSKPIFRTALSLNIRKGNNPSRNKPQRSPPSKTRSPTRIVMVNGDNVKADASPLPKRPQARRLNKSSSTSSLSSLSSVDEDVIQGGPPDALSLLLDKVTSEGDSDESPNHRSSQQSSQNALKRSSAEAGLPIDHQEHDIEMRKSKCLKRFDDVPVRLSNVREPPKSAQLWAEAQEARTLQRTADGAESLRNGVVARLVRDQAGDSQSRSSEALASGAAVPLRKGTPDALENPPKKATRAARIKMSPVKKRSVVVAGLPPADGGANSPVGDDDNEQRSDNNDYCSACGGSGYLLCCDGCDRSFHFTCLDPPLDQNASLDEPWFCRTCGTRREPQMRPRHGLFAALLSDLEKRNPSAYSLPVEIRDYFEGVKTGEEGEYEEALTQKALTRSGYSNEPPDYRKLRDSKGNFILCYACGKSALNGQPIVLCDFCSLSWHLDCLDPPLSNPPSWAVEGNLRHQWKCPIHAEHDLLAVASRSTGRTCKVRRPKNAQVRDTALLRGHKNNGLIEIDNDLSDEEVLFEEVDDTGVVYRLPERGIKLDFIDRVKRLREEEALRRSSAITASHLALSRARATADTNLQLRQSLARRSFVERKMALNLTQFAQAHDNLILSADEIENLVTALVAEAPPEVVAQIVESGTDGAPEANPPVCGVPPSPPSSEQTECLGNREKRSLLALQELIKRRLDGVKS